MVQLDHRPTRSPPQPSLTSTAVHPGADLNRSRLRHPIRTVSPWTGPHFATTHETLGLAYPAGRTHPFEVGRSGGRP